MGDEGRDRLELTAVGAAIVAGVRGSLASWIEARAALILDAWGRIETHARARVDAEVRAAGRAATERVARELDSLFALDPAEQRTTPLAVVRTAYREPTVVLAAAGVPEVVRDPFDERAWPDDVYGLVPRTFTDLGDDALGPLHVAWGLAKAKAIRAASGSREGG